MFQFSTVKMKLEQLAGALRSRLYRSGLLKFKNYQSEKNYSYDALTAEIMDKILRDNSNCVDVGCHKGAILNQIILRSPDGQHYAFEPLPELYRGLKKKYERKPNVKLFDCALSDSCGESTYQHVVTNPGYSGLRQRRYDRAEEKIVQLMVRIEMLDNVIPEDVQVRFIKIDVEGGELQVLRGAAKTIKRCRPFIIFEHGLGAADHYGTTPEDMYRLLSGNYGMRVFRIEDWIRTDGAKNLSQEEFCNHYYKGSEFYFLASE